MDRSLKSFEEAMLDHNSFSALDRHAVLGGFDNGLPWYAGVMLSTGPCDAVGFGKPRPGDEAVPTLGETIAAAFEAVASWLSGATPPAILNHYREHVAGTVGRLPAG